MAEIAGWLAPGIMVQVDNYLPFMRKNPDTGEAEAIHAVHIAKTLYSLEVLAVSQELFDRLLVDRLDLHPLHATTLPTE